jgi:hypothetical protein
VIFANKLKDSTTHSIGCGCYNRGGDKDSALVETLPYCCL